MLLFWESRLDKVSSSVKDLPSRLIDFQIIGPEDHIVRILKRLAHICLNNEAGS